MRLRHLVVVFTVLVADLCVTLAWPASEDIKENVRWKRQSHPEATVAILGEVGGGSEPGGEGEPLPYLVPPAAGAEGRGAVGKEGGRWELGWEAGDILVPPLPEAHPGPYETMREQPQQQPAEPLPAASGLLPTTSGPLPSGVFTFVQTDPEGRFKWGVRHDPLS